MTTTTRMQQFTPVLRCEYPVIEEFTKQQLKVFWTAEEIAVENDIHDVLTNFTPAERHGVFTTLKLFSLYEMKAGSEYWTGRFMKDFKRHEFQAMGSVFGMFELAVHKPFYNKINELLNATNDSFYTDYIDTPVLKDRMEFIDKYIDHEDTLVSLGVFSMVEGVILYSSFAFLKHFQSLGKNKLLNIVRGINFSVRDENIHAQAGAYVFKQLIKERKMGLPKNVKDAIIDASQHLLEHELEIINMTFSQGEIDGITATQMSHFVSERIGYCLAQLGLETEVAPTSDISKWFYKGINNIQVNDFFTGQGREYSRDWNESKFTW